MTVPELFALSQGIALQGDSQCFFCGAAADGTYRAADYVRDSFTGRNDVACPGSAVVCAGCVLCLREDCEVRYPGGTRKHQTKAAMRGHSWVISTSGGIGAFAATKAHLGFLRDVCLDPPAPPFAIVLSDSGKKHLLYKGVVCWSAESPIATLEGERIDYRPADLAGRIDLCGQLIAATGKPALAEPPSVRLALAVCERFAAGLTMISQWEHLHAEPLSRLAAWLCPGREGCQQLYSATAAPGLRDVPA